MALDTPEYKAVNEPKNRASLETASKITCDILLQKFKDKGWLEETCQNNDIKFLIVVALNKIEANGRNYKAFMKMLNDADLKDTAEKIEGMCQ